MNKKLKEELKSLVENEELIPRRLWQRVLWLQENESFGIERNGRIHWTDARGKRVGSWKGYFVKKRDPLDEQWIENILKDYLLFLKEELTARDILRCSNVEIRRILLLDFGFERFVEEFGGTIIHSDGDSELILLQIRKSEEPIMVVKVRDSTMKETYLLRVPPHVRTCKEAIAWTFSMDESEYNPVIET
ncbi:MAG: hypothetical protein JSV04_05465 [Candidatus Heimdallarchaeota archaeon]|nr:MAG: hypothetical protein JSV04_05465 [Candidatus Heimdallarchaeota archaeon]